MKIKIEPSKFKGIIEAGMIYKSRPFIDPLVMQFSKEGAIVADSFSEVIGVHMILSKDFFLSYESEKEVVAIPSVVLDRLGWGFKDEKMSVSTKEDKIFLKGGADAFDTELDDLEPRPFPQALKKTKYGMLPEKLEIKSAIQLDAKELQLPSADNYYFELKGKKLSVSISKEGNFTRTFKGELVGEENIKLILDSEYFNAVVNNLNGNILFVLDKEMAIFAEKEENYTKTFLLAPKIIEEDSG